MRVKALLGALVVPAVWAPASAAAIESRSLVPASIEVEPDGYFVLGLALENSSDVGRVYRLDDGTTIEESTFWENQLYGLSLDYERQDFGLGGRLLFTPSFDDLSDWRILLGLGGRAKLRLFGIEWLLGGGTEIELRLLDHFWMMYVTPAALGATVYEGHTARVRLFVGPRVVVAGDLVQNFLLDPNGFDNEASAALVRGRKGAPWIFFATAVFARKLD